jgi:hypothetical protein
MARRAQIAGYPTPVQVGAASALATMGALPLGQIPEAVNQDEAAPAPDDRLATLYAVSAVGGAAIGGGIVGYVSAGDVRGLGTGALLTSGLASVADAFVLVRRPERRALGIGLGIGGALAIGASIFLAANRKIARGGT